MLYLLGSGLYYLNDIPLRAISVMKTCDHIFLERYTNINDIGAIAEIEKAVGKSINIVSRSEVEDDSIISIAAGSDVALLVPGDSLFATTHVSLLAECRKRGIAYTVVHAGSILAAVAETGLSLYKFGAVCSIPIYTDNFKPESFFEIVEKNLKEGFHSLVLLEAKSDKEFVDLDTAIKRLKTVESKHGHAIIDWENVICMSHMGSKDQHMFFVSSRRNAEKPPLALVIPSIISRIEKENLDSFVEH